MSFPARTLGFKTSPQHAEWAVLDETWSAAGELRVFSAGWMNDHRNEMSVWMADHPEWMRRHRTNMGPWLSTHPGWMRSHWGDVGTWMGAHPGWMRAHWETMGSRIYDQQGR